MEYRDYYKIMGVDRKATQDEIKRSYRKLARKYHPDVSKEKDAEERFKELGEAYAVLKDPESRAAYDELGSNWKAGKDFQPPPDWGAGFEFSGSGFGGDADGRYSDFFESLFGQHARAQGGAARSRQFRSRGDDHHARVLVDLEDAYRGATRAINLRVPMLDENGHVSTRERTLNVKIPKGIRAGQRIRLSGQGSPGYGGGESGDLFLEVAFRQHPRYTVDERDVFMTLPVTPWEATLGATIKVPTPSGAVDLKVPSGSKQGSKLRLKGRGIPSDPPGDFIVELAIALPPAKSDKEKDAYRKMQQAFDFNPRTHLGA
ncbi:MAG TPA: DnaJ C-terminal domain-containing protein [Woeseiaceae bacterium]|nr:DnaJ C-terminal domain-containing protein [Woeseiaceae bacterium]